MRTTPRRRARLRSAQGATDRWKPPTTLIVVVVGLLVGLALGIGTRVADRAANVEQHYLLLVSDLYAQGVPLADVRARLLAVGYAQPSIAVLGAADALARSPDALSQQEAAQLHQLAAVLLAGPESPTTVAPQPVTQPVVGTTSIVLAPTPDPAAEVGIVPTGYVSPVPSESPGPTTTAETPGPTTVSDVVAPPPLPTATLAPPTPQPTPKATAAPAKPGRVRTVGGTPAILRAGASTKTTAVAVVPNGATISVYGSLDGEAPEPPVATWYHVVYNGKPGYLYAKQLKVGG
jgi:Bacterial SH3 domain